ncbi:hypothetical protein AURDEDRAFT_170417 [Auricularia subglabra TFB-10046 SS5]|nr:hypothetical protein AURDEDRAFT_170417 [Auricularia subglabra TFB-10046 SS5]
MLLALSLHYEASRTVLFCISTMERLRRPAALPLTAITSDADGRPTDADHPQPVRFILSDAVRQSRSLPPSPSRQARCGGGSVIRAAPRLQARFLTQARARFSRLARAVDDASFVWDAEERRSVGYPRILHEWHRRASQGKSLGARDSPVGAWRGAKRVAVKPPLLAEGRRGWITGKHICHLMLFQDAFVVYAVGSDPGSCSESMNGLCEQVFPMSKMICRPITERGVAWAKTKGMMQGDKGLRGDGCKGLALAGAGLPRLPRRRMRVHATALVLQAGSRDAAPSASLRTSPASSVTTGTTLQVFIADLTCGCRRLSDAAKRLFVFLAPMPSG